MNNLLESICKSFSDLDRATSRNCPPSWRAASRPRRALPGPGFGALLAVLMCVRSIWGAEATYSKVGAAICGGGQFTISGDSSGPVLHAAADCFTIYMKDLGAGEFEPGVATGLSLQVVNP